MGLFLYLMKLEQERGIVAAFDVTDVFHPFDGTTDVPIEMKETTEIRIRFRMNHRVGPDLVHP